MAISGGNAENSTEANAGASCPPSYIAPSLHQQLAERLKNITGPHEQAAPSRGANATCQMGATTCEATVQAADTQVMASEIRDVAEGVPTRSDSGAANDINQVQSEAALRDASLTTHITLRGLSGDCDQIELMGHPVTVACLKKRIAELWHIPIVCQHIVADVRTLRDSDEIGNVDSEATPLTMLITLDSVLCDLDQDCASSEQKVSAMEILAQLGRKGGNRALSSASCHLLDRHDEVRVAALRVLGAVATKGNTDAIQAAIFAMSDARSIVRQEATRVLGVLAERGDMCARDAAISLLPYGDADFMIAAMGALKVTIETGSADCIAAVVACFKQSCIEGALALEALGALLEKGSMQACADLIALLITSMHSVVQEVALKELVAMINTGDAAALLSLSHCMRGDGRLAVAAVSTLANHVCKGKEEIAAAVATCMETSDWDAWSAIVEAFSVVTEEGDDRPMNAVAAHVEASDWRIRRVALLALVALLQRGDTCARKRALVALIPRMEDENRLVQQVAFRAFDLLNG